MLSFDWIVDVVSFLSPVLNLSLSWGEGFFLGLSKFLGNHGSFHILLLRFVSLGLIWPHHWGNAFVRTDKCSVLGSLSTWLVGAQIIFGPVWALGIVLLIPFQWFFPKSWAVFLYPGAYQYWAKNLRDPSANLPDSFCASFSFLNICRENSIHPGFHKLQTLFLQLRRTAGLWVCLLCGTEPCYKLECS